MVDEVEFEQLRDQLRANAGAMGKMTAALEAQNKGSSRSGSRRDAARKLEADMESAGQTMRNAAYKTATATEHVSTSMSILTGRTDVAAERLKVFAQAIPGGAILGSMVAWGKNTIDTWRSMTEVGQSFNGSMFDLAQAAAEAGVPLDEFAEAVKKHSKTVAVYGARQVTQLMKDVRKTTEANGMYGYTMEQLNNVTGEYLESQRLFGNKSAATNKRSIESSAEFAKQITAVAGATGQARETVLAATMSAMRDVAFTSAMIGRSSGDIQAFSDATMKSVAILAGLPGVAGETFGQFLSQSVGFGTAIFSDATQTFIEGGLGQMVSSTDALAAAITNGGGDIEGATWQYIEDFKGQVEGNREGLRIQAMAGNQSAKRILQMYSEVENITKADYDRRKKEADDTKALTAFFASVGNVFKRLLSSLMVGVFGKLEDIEGKVGDIFDSPAFLGLEKRFEGWGKSIGAWMEKIDEKQVQDFADGIERAVGTVLNVINVLAAFGQGLTKVMSFFSKFGSLGTAAGLAGAFLFITSLPKMLGGAFSKIMAVFGRAKQNDMTVRASNVYVNGGAVGGDGGGGGGPSLEDFLGGGGGGDNTPDRERGERRRGRQRGGRRGRGSARAGRAAREAARDSSRLGGTLRNVSNGARGSGLFRGLLKGGEKMGAKGLGKGLLKTGLKKIPGLSILAGLGFGAERLMGGDWKGAGLEALSGLAGTIPGIGTAASVAIDAGLMARDAGAFGGGGQAGPAGGNESNRARPSNQPNGRRGGRFSRLGALASGVAGSGVVGLGAAWAMNAFSGGNAGPNSEGAVNALERALESQNRTAQTDPRIANLEKQTTEMKAIQEAQLLTNREVLSTLKRLLQVQQQVNSSLS